MNTEPALPNVQSSVEASTQTSGLSFFWSPSMMEMAKREPQLQGHEFSLSCCLAVASVSLPAAPRESDASQEQPPFALTMADTAFIGLLQQL